MKRLLFIIPLLAWAASAGAVNTSDIVELSCLINIGVDSGNYAIDSVVFRSRHHRTLAGRWTWLGKGSKCVIHTTDSNLAGSVFTDSLCWTVSVPIDSFESVNLAFDYMPTIAAWVYWDSASGRGISREDIDISPVLRSIYSADSVTAQLPDSVTVNVNYDSIRVAVASAMVGGGSEAVQIAVYDTSCHCPGSALINNVDVIVRPWDFSRVEAWGTTTNGRLTFALDTGIHWVTAASAGYFNAHDGVWAPDWDSLYVDGPMTKYLLMYTFTPSILPGPDSCLLIIFTDVAGSTAEFSSLSSQSQSTAGVGLNPYVPVTVSDSLGIIQRALPQTAATRQGTKWKIVVKGPEGAVIMSEPAYTVPTQSMDTLLVPIK